MSEKAPDVSIDEALRLFLTVAYPQGLPEGADEQQLMDLLRDKVALDRPEWGRASGHVTESESPWVARSRGESVEELRENEEASSEDTTEPQAKANPDIKSGPEIQAESKPIAASDDETSAAEVLAVQSSPPAAKPAKGPVAGAPDYAKIKDEIVRLANQEEVPTDPEERYFYYRARELQEAVEKKKAEEKENQVKDELRRKLLEENSGGRVQETTIEKAFRIRQVLEGKFRESLEGRLTPEGDIKPPPGKEPSLKPNIPRPAFAKAEFKNAYTGDTDSAKLAMEAANVSVPRTPMEEAPSSAGEMALSEVGKTESSPSRELSAEDKLASFREWNEMRRGNLKDRKDIIQSRNQGDRRSAMSMKMERTERKAEKPVLETSPRSRGVALQEIRASMKNRPKEDSAMSMKNEMSDSPRIVRRGMSLDDSSRRRE